MKTFYDKPSFQSMPTPSSTLQSFCLARGLCTRAINDNMELTQGQTLITFPALLRVSCEEGKEKKEKKEVSHLHFFLSIKFNML